MENLRPLLLASHLPRVFGFRCTIAIDHHIQPEENVIQSFYKTA
jgi:hypothetical protein